MKNDKKILELMREIRDACAYFVSYVEGLNPCAHTDRVVEKVITLAADLKEAQDNNFSKEEE